MKSPLLFLVLGTSLPLYCMNVVKVKIQIKLCANCDKSPALDECKKLSKCGACKAVYYCSKECQRADYGYRHKKECKKLKEQSSLVGNQEQLNRKLHALVEKGSNPKHVKLLIKAGACVDAHNNRTFKGCTPLMVACSKGMIDIVTALVASGADVNAQMKDDTSKTVRPRDTSRTFGDVQFMQLLVHLQTSKKPRAYTPLMYAAQEGHYEVCELLLQHGASAGIITSYREDPRDNPLNADEALYTEEDRFNTAISCAVKRGDTMIARLLLEHGAHEVINQVSSSIFNPFFVKKKIVYGETPLFMALNAKDSEMCLLLIRYGAYVNALEEVSVMRDEVNALVLAAQHSLPEVCRAIIIRILSLHPLEEISDALKAVMERAYKKASSEEVRKVVTFASVEELVSASLDDEVLPMKKLKKQNDETTIDNTSDRLPFYMALTSGQADMCLLFLKEQKPVHMCALESFKIKGKDVNPLVVAAKNNMPKVCDQLIVCAIVSHSFGKIEAKLKAIMQQAYEVATTNELREILDFERVKRNRDALSILDRITSN